MKGGFWTRNRLILLFLALIGVLLLILGSFLGNRGEEDADYAAYLERRAREICRSIDGVEDAQVFLTLAETVPVSTGGGWFSDGESGGGSLPEVRGVAVVCTGGNLPRIREAVTQLLSAAMGIPSNRIRVAGKSA